MIVPGCTRSRAVRACRLRIGFVSPAVLEYLQGGDVALSRVSMRSAVAAVRDEQRRDGNAGGRCRGVGRRQTGQGSTAPLVYGFREVVAGDRHEIMALLRRCANVRTMLPALRSRMVDL